MEFLLNKWVKVNNPFFPQSYHLRFNDQSTGYYGLNTMDKTFFHKITGSITSMISLFIETNSQEGVVDAI